MGAHKKLPISFNVRNVQEVFPYNELLIIPTHHKFWTKPEFYTYEAFLIKSVFLRLIPLKSESVEIHEVIIASDRTKSDTKYGSLGMRFGNVFASSSFPYGTVNFDVDFMFILKDGRIIETNTKEKRDVELIFPMLKQQTEKATWAQTRKLADRKAQMLAIPALHRAPMLSAPAVSKQLIAPLPMYQKEKKNTFKKNNKGENEIMDTQKITASELWNYITADLKNDSKEIQTIDKDGNTFGGKWFTAYSSGDSICIDKAKSNSPSSSIKNIHVISKAEFSALYSNYFKWRAGTMQRNVAKGKSMNSSYIFAIINAFNN